MKKLLIKLLDKLGFVPREKLDYVYKQRNIAAMVAAKIAYSANWFAEEAKLPQPFIIDMYQDTQNDWDEEWRTVLQITKTKYNLLSSRRGVQISWHLGPECGEFAKQYFLEKNQAEWDGTDFSKTFDFLIL